MTIIMNMFLILLGIISLFGCSTKPTYFEKCWHAETGGTSIPFTGGRENPQYRAECAPDTLYSWLSEEKIDSKVFPTNPLRMGKYLYTWRTPLSTYAYGNIQIRLKLKPFVKFKWLVKNNSQERPRCPMKEQAETVFVLTTTYEKVVSEYLICSPEVIESWSLQTKGAYYEAKNEYDYLQKHGKENPQVYDAFGFGFDRRKMKLANSDSYFINWDQHQIKWSDELLLRSVNSLKKPIHKLSGKIFGSETQKHFETKVRSYFELSPAQENDL